MRHFCGCIFGIGLDLAQSLDMYLRRALMLVHIRIIIGAIMQNQKQPLDFSSQDSSSPSYHAYLTLLGLNLAQCFPIDRVEDRTVDFVDANSITAGSRLYVAISRIVDETWTQYTQQQGQRRQNPQQQQRIA